MNDLIERQAAIEIVRKAKDKSEAHRMMVQLPSAQPECEDAVSRFEVLRLIDYSSNDLNDSVDNWYFQGKVKELPSVTPKQPGWIPTSVRLPEDNEEVLFCDNEGERWLGWHYGFWKTERLDFDEDEVVAWMPLPAPAKIEG